MCDSCFGAPTLRSAAVPLGVLQVSDVEPIEVTPGLEIWPRAAWAGDARPPLATIPAEEVRFLLVHHSAAHLEHTAEEVPAILASYYDFHTGTRGWPDLAYNFMIDRFGRVWETHDGSIEGPLQGYATGGNQGFSQLVCLIGDFTAAMPTPEALDALTRTLAWLAERDGVEIGAGVTTTFVSRGSNRHAEGVEVTTPTIAGHRTMSLTSCPGDTFFAYVEADLPDVVARARAAAGPPTSTTEATTTSTTATSTTVPSTAATSTAATSTSMTASSSVAATTDAAVAPARDSGTSRLGTGIVVASGFAVLGMLVRLRRRPAPDSPGR